MEQRKEGNWFLPRKVGGRARFDRGQASTCNQKKKTKTEWKKGGKIGGGGGETTCIIIRVETKGGAKTRRRKRG